MLIWVIACTMLTSNEDHTMATADELGGCNETTLAAAVALTDGHLAGGTAASHGIQSNGSIWTGLADISLLASCKVKVATAVEQQAAKGIIDALERICIRFVEVGNCPRVRCFADSLTTSESKKE